MGFEWSFSVRIWVQQAVRMHDRVGVRVFLTARNDDGRRYGGAVDRGRHTSTKPRRRGGKIETMQDQGWRHDVSGKDRGPAQKMSMTSNLPSCKWDRLANRKRQVQIGRKGM